MDGETALKYARSRETTSDFDRAARQQKIIIATREKLTANGTWTNPKKILDLVDIVSDHVRTDFTPNELIELANLIKQIDTSKAVSKVLTTGAGGELYSEAGSSILKPIGGNFSAIQKIAHELFTDPDLKKENAKIELLNGSSKVGLASGLAESLTSYNYNIVSVATSDTKYANTTIINYSGDNNPVTVQFLKQRLNAKVINKEDKSKTGKIDIAVIIGDDYKGFSKNP